MIEIISKDIIEDVLSTEHRQYLVGNLKIPQVLEHIHDDNIEVGITRFSEYAWEKPHYHPIVTEYQILLSGEAKYVDIETGKEYIIKSGDFFVIHPNTKYIQKGVVGTVILFFKSPGGNDKILLEITPKMKRWGDNWCAHWDECSDG